MNLIDCYVFIDNFEEAEKLVSDLNSKKSKKSKSFYIGDSGPIASHLIIGKVTEKDFKKLKLEEKFVVSRNS